MRCSLLRGFQRPLIELSISEGRAISKNGRCQIQSDRNHYIVRMQFSLSLSPLQVGKVNFRTVVKKSLCAKSKVRIDFAIFYAAFKRGSWFLASSFLQGDLYRDVILAHIPNRKIKAYIVCEFPRTAVCSRGRCVCIYLVCLKDASFRSGVQYIFLRCKRNDLVSIFAIFRFRPWFPPIHTRKKGIPRLG